MQDSVVPYLAMISSFLHSFNQVHILHTRNSKVSGKTFNIMFHFLHAQTHFLVSVTWNVTRIRNGTVFLLVPTIKLELFMFVPKRSIPSTGNITKY